jgi:pimeloyl-ACP methyl ester carboxylesterase
VVSGDDRVVPTAQSRRLSGELPHAELSVLPACGHVLQEEFPQAFLDEVLGFIKKGNED